MLLRHSFVLIVTLFTLFNVQSIEGKRGRYRYNHPPSIETADAVPVGVVPETGDVRESKTLKLPVDSKTDSTENITKANENNKENREPTQISKTDIPEPQEQKKSVERKPLLSRTNNRRNLQIPVNVVYETEPNKQPLQESEEGSKKLVQRRNQIRRRLQKPKAIEDSQKEEPKPQEDKNKNEEQRLNGDTSNSNQDKKRAESSSTVAPSTTSPKSETKQPTITNEQPSVTTERSRKRTRTRPPVVPIVTEENFVYSHSGNFHYR